MSTAVLLPILPKPAILNLAVEITGVRTRKKKDFPIVFFHFKTAHTTNKFQ